MAVTGSRIIKMTANLDTFDSGQRRLKIAGIRLIAGSGANATAKLFELNSSGMTLYSLAAVQATADESQLPLMVDSGKLYLELTGAGAEVYVYTE